MMLLIIQRKKGNDMVWEIVYSSVAYNKQTDSSLEQILDTALEFNSKNDITGALVYIEGTREFIQVLEGNKEKIEDLMNKIRKDSRHTNVDILSNESITSRQFPNWSMALSKIDSNKLVEFGLNKDITFNKEKNSLIQFRTLLKKINFQSYV